MLQGFPSSSRSQESIFILALVTTLGYINRQTKAERKNLYGGAEFKIAIIGRLELNAAVSWTIPMCEAGIDLPNLCPFLYPVSFGGEPHLISRPSTFAINIERTPVRVL